MNGKIDSLKFAISSGIVIAVCFTLTTFLAILNVPGYTYFALQLENIYGFYGYSISYLGLLTGAIYGFIEGFVWLGLFALVYNKLMRKR